MKVYRRLIRVCRIALTIGLAVVVWCSGEAAEPTKPEFLISAFDLGAVEQVRTTDAELATELTAQGWCLAQPKGKAGAWSDVPAGVDPNKFVSVVAVGFGNRAEAYAFQFNGPDRAAKLVAHVPHRKRPALGGERWFSPFGNLLDAFRIGYAANQKAQPLPPLQLEVVLTNPKGGTGGAEEALTLAPDKVLPPMQVIATAAACSAGWAPTTQKADTRARVEVRVLDMACAFKVVLTRNGKETVLTRDRVPWEEYHDQLTMLLSIPTARPNVADFARPSPESVELLAVEANRIVCLVDGELTALDAATGAEAWRLRIPQSKTAARRVEHYAARRDAGGKLRLFRLSTSLTEVAVTDGAVTPLAPTPATAFDVGAGTEAVMVQGGKLTSVSRGKEVWSVTEPEPIVAGPRLEADRILVGTARGELVAFARTDHRELWRVPLGKRLWGPITTAGALRLIFSPDDETLLAIDPKDGSVKWKFATGDTLVQPPFEFDGSVIVATKQNRIVKLNPESGAVVTESSWPTWLTTVEPVLLGGRKQLAVGDVAGRVTVLGPELKKTWESSLTARITGRPVVAVTPPIWKGKAKPVKGGPDDLLDSIASDAAGTKPFLLTTDGAGFLYKLSTEGIK